jgi:hypothetical protein
MNPKSGDPRLVDCRGVDSSSSHNLRRALLISRAPTHIGSAPWTAYSSREPRIGKIDSGGGGMNVPLVVAVVIGVVVVVVVSVRGVVVLVVIVIGTVVSTADADGLSSLSDRSPSDPSSNQE